jgi:hypothetical protein
LAAHPFIGAGFSENGARPSSSANLMKNPMSTNVLGLASPSMGQPDVT